MRLTRMVLGVAVAFGLCLTVPAPAQAARWTTVDSDCHVDGVEGWTQYNWCWSKRKRVEDNTPNKDLFIFRMTSSGTALGSKYLEKLWVEPEPRSTSPAMSWAGADPWKPDQTTTTDQSCTTWSWNIGATVGVVTAGYSESGQVCKKESYGPKLRTADGHHAAVWHREDCVPAGVTKKVAAAVLVRVAQGKVPTWSSEKRGANARSSRDNCR